VSALFTLCSGDTVQTGTGMVDPAWEFKCTTAASIIYCAKFKISISIFLFKILAEEKNKANL